MAAPSVPGLRAAAKSPHRRNVLGPTATTRLPQVGPDQRLCAMLKCLFDRHDRYRRWLLPLTAKRRLRSASRLIRARQFTRYVSFTPHEEDQPNARILDKVLETIDPIVAAPVGYEQRPTVICNLHEARPIALGRAVSNGALQRRGKTSQIRLAATPSFQILTCQIQFAARVRFAA